MAMAWRAHAPSWSQWAPVRHAQRAMFQRTAVLAGIAHPLASLAHPAAIFARSPAATRAHAASAADAAASGPGAPANATSASTTSAASTGESAESAATDPTSAFDALFARCERQVFGCLWRLTGDRQLASDLCQETFLRAWQQFARVAAHDEPLAWLLRVATNLALNYLRRGNTRVGFPRTLSEHNAPAQDDPTARVPERDLVLQTLLALPAAMRAALVLREVYGLSFAEIGQALGITPAAARMSLSRAREQFRQRYRREEEHV